MGAHVCPCLARRRVRAATWTLTVRPATSAWKDTVGRWSAGNLNRELLNLARIVARALTVISRLDSAAGFNEDRGCSQRSCAPTLPTQKFVSDQSQPTK